METQQLHNIIESCLLVAGKAMSVAQLETLFDEDIDRPERSEIKEAMVSLQASYEGRGIELVEVSSGWRLQSAASMQHWVSRLFEERPPRYSRALLETLVLIAYRQPITRGEIEDVRGVAVSSNIIRTLQEREWIKEMGFKDVPGKPALWGTTKAFLDYFNLKRLDELPSLAEARDLAEIDAALAAEMGVVDGADDGVAANDEQGESVQGESAQGEGAQGESAQGESALGENVQGDSAEGESTRGESVLGESSITDEPKLADLANSIDADDAITDEPKLGDLAKELEANSADTDEPELADLANSLEVESVDEPELADLAGALQEENTNALSLGDVANHLGANNNSDAALGFSDLANAHTNDLAGDQAGNSANDLEADSESSNKASDEASSEPPVLEATEISAFDLDIEQMPQTADKTDAATEASDSAVSANEAESQTNGSVAPSDTNSESSSNTSAGNGAEPDRGEAEADLRKVIDDFAEEHRKQLDDRNSHRATFGEGQNTTSGPSVDTRAVEETPEPLINGDDEQSVASAKLYGVHGSVDAEVDSADSDASEQLKGSDTDYGSSANSGDP